MVQTVQDTKNDQIYLLYFFLNQKKFKMVIKGIKRKVK